MTYFPFDNYWFLYLGFTLFVFFMLALDLGVFNRKIHEVSIKEASIWTGVWISLALLFNIAFYYYSLDKFTSIPNFESLYGIAPAAQAKLLGIEFLTGFIIEKTLAIDNIFIFALVFATFKIPKLYQHRILFWGILGALLFRGIFIGIGSYLIQYHYIVIVFGVILIFTGLKLFINGNSESTLEGNKFIKFLNKILPVHPKIEDKSFIKKINNKYYITPLFLALIFIEFTDIIFAVDSVPAIFAITKEPLIVFTSNIFAILGLRSMYFLLVGVLDKFQYIKYGLAGILVFVGMKMAFLNELFEGKFPIHWSLLIILFILLTSILASLFIKKNKIEVIS